VSSTILPPPFTASTGLAFPHPKRWTCEEFHRLGDAGLLRDKTLILVNGEILETPPAGGPHDVALTLLDDIIRKVFSGGFVVRCQMSLVLGKTTDPVPDLAVVQGIARAFIQKPTTASLVVEVSDSSLDYDTGDKACLYASAGIADYWVVDLVSRRLIVFRDPRADAAKPFSFAYATITVRQPGDNMAPLAAPGSQIAVADLLP
jgi:Uma2 family endonuclease